MKRMVIVAALALAGCEIHTEAQLAELDAAKEKCKQTNQCGAYLVLKEEADAREQAYDDLADAISEAADSYRPTVQCTTTGWGYSSQTTCY